MDATVPRSLPPADERLEGIFKLRSRLLGLRSPEAMRLCDGIFAFLLKHAIAAEDSGLRVFIQSRDPQGFVVGERRRDRIVIEHEATGRRASVAQARLVRDWALTAYLMAHGAVALPTPPNPPPRHVPIPGEMSALEREVAALLGTPPPTADVFDDT